VNAAVAVHTKRFLGQLSLNYAGEAFWADVLTSPFSGPTSAYTMVNASVGWRFRDGKVTTILKGTNLANREIQQHNFGDLLKRSVAAEVHVSL
jgi:hypothetical protein